jgi:hypothetical protein
MLVANGIPPNQKTNAWMTAVAQYLRFLSLAGTAAFATQRPFAWEFFEKAQPLEFEFGHTE